VRARSASPSDASRWQTSYAKQRSTFGSPLAERQAVQWMLADMFIELQAARLLVYRTAARLDQGEEAR